MPRPFFGLEVDDVLGAGASVRQACRTLSGLSPLGSAPFASSPRSSSATGPASGAWLRGPMRGPGAPGAVANRTRSSRRPVLDGRLDDPVATVPGRACAGGYLHLLAHYAYISWSPAPLSGRRTQPLGRGRLSTGVMTESENRRWFDATCSCGRQGTRTKRFLPYRRRSSFGVVVEDDVGNPCRRGAVQDALREQDARGGSSSQIEAISSF